MIIRFPSSLGSCSTAPKSESSLANFNKSNSPRSLKTMVRPLKNGERTKGYVEYIREDGKIDISLAPIGLEKFDEFSESVLDYLKANNGVSTVTDNSSPDLIRAELGMSKKSFKKAVGNLYKNKKITLTDTTIELL